MQAVLHGGKRRQVLVVAEGRSYPEQTERALRWVDRSVVTYHFSDPPSVMNYLSECGVRYPVPDLMLLDHVLPSGGDGWTILEAVRRMSALNGLPVFIVSSSGEDEDFRRAEAAGAAGFLIKPVQKEDYRTFARQVLEWKPREKIAHELRTLLARAVSPVEPPALSSRTMSSASPAAPACPPNFLTALWGGLTAYVPELKGLAPALLDGVFVDQDSADIRFAVNQARISQAHVENTSLQDHDTQDKRRMFYGVLIRRGWTIPQIQERFPSARLDHLKKIRGSVRRSRTDRALPER